MVSTDKRERRAHFRGKSRPGRRLEVTYRRADAPDAPPARAHTKNVGVGGAFIVTRHPEPIGTALAIELRVPTADRAPRVTAEVRWATDGGDDPDAAGIGVKFDTLDVDQTLALSEYFASLTGTEQVTSQ